jgi:hypothetical protein
LRVKILTSSTSSATVSEIRSAVNSIGITSARARTGAPSAAPQQPPLRGLVQCAWRRQSGLVAPHVWTPETEVSVQRVERREREVDRRRGRAPLDLQPATEVAGGVIARERVAQRVALPAIAVRRRREPRAVHPDVACVLSPGAVRQRPAGEPALKQCRYVGELDRVAHQAGERICRRGGSPFVLPRGPGLSPPSPVLRRQRAVPPSLLVLAFQLAIGSDRPT